LHLILPNKDGSTTECSEFTQSMHIEDLLKVKPSAIKGLPSIELPRAVQSHATQYIKQQDWSLSVVDKPIEKPQAPIKMSSRKSNNHDTVTKQCQHQAFGEGRLVQETDRHWHIQFGDGHVRVLDKVVSEPLLVWLS